MRAFVEAFAEAVAVLAALVVSYIDCAHKARRWADGQTPDTSLPNIFIHVMRVPSFVPTLALAPDLHSFTKTELQHMERQLLHCIRRGAAHPPLSVHQVRASTSDTYRIPQGR